MSDRIYKMLENDEGKTNKLYKCPAGKLTIGIGWNIEDNGIPDDVVYQLLRHGVKMATADMIDVLGVEYIPQLSDAQFDALVMMSFNLGKTRFATFKKMLEAVRKEDYKKAQEEMKDSKWAVQVGKRADRLIKLMGEVE